MAKHCIFEHFLRFVKQIRPKPSVVVTPQKQPDLRSFFKKKGPADAQPVAVPTSEPPEPEVATETGLVKKESGEETGRNSAEAAKPGGVLLHNIHFLKGKGALTQ